MDITIDKKIIFCTFIPSLIFSKISLFAKPIN